MGNPLSGPKKIKTAGFDVIDGFREKLDYLRRTLNGDEQRPFNKDVLTGWFHDLQGLEQQYLAAIEREEKK